MVPLLAQLISATVVAIDRLPPLAKECTQCSTSQQGDEHFPHEISRACNGTNVVSGGNVGNETAVVSLTTHDTLSSGFPRSSDESTSEPSAVVASHRAWVKEKLFCLCAYALVRVA